MDSNEIGVVLMVVGVCQLLWQVRSHCLCTMVILAACAGDVSVGGL